MAADSHSGASRSVAGEVTNSKGARKAGQGDAHRFEPGLHRRRVGHVGGDEGGDGRGRRQNRQQIKHEQGAAMGCTPRSVVPARPAARRAQIRPRSLGQCPNLRNDPGVGHPLPPCRDRRLRRLWPRSGGADRARGMSRHRADLPRSLAAHPPDHDSCAIDLTGVPARGRRGLSYRPDPADQRSGLYAMSDPSLEDRAVPIAGGTRSSGGEWPWRWQRRAQGSASPAPAKAMP